MTGIQELEEDYRKKGIPYWYKVRVAFFIELLHRTNLWTMHADHLP
jgi:hypothetical protein